MHYAIVSETYPPEVNGVALTVQALEQGLRARGHDVDVIRPRQREAAAPVPGELLVRGVRLPRYPGLQFGLPVTRKLLRHWKADPPTAIYIATEGPLGWSALRAARRLGIPVATGLHTRFDQYMRDYGAAWLAPVALGWMRRFHNRADATLVPTRELTGLLELHGLTNARRLPRAVDTKRFNPGWRDADLRRQWGAGPHDLVVLHVGRLAAEKNLDLAVRAFRRVQQVRPDARFVWVGDGPARARLEADNPDFIFTGVQRGESLARHYAGGDLFLFPSRSETFGNVTLEAMASGVPTIAFDYGATREHLRDGEHGAAIADGDDDGFIAAAMRLAGDDDTRTAMSRAVVDAVSQLRPQQVAADFDALLQQLAHGGRHEPSALAQTPHGR